MIVFKNPTFKETTATIKNIRNKKKIKKSERKETSGGPKSNYQKQRENKS